MRAPAPVEELRAASAMVFVADLEDPVLSPEDAHHLAKVLRLRAGEAVVASDGAGSWRPCRFTGRAARPSSGATAALEADGPVRSEPRPRPEIEVALCWAKGERTEWALAKLVELGVDVVTPLVAERAVVRPDTGPSARRTRLMRIVREAAMQSRRVRLPRLGEPERPAEILARAGAGRVALAEPGGEPVSLGRPVVLIGPEGGWSERELSLVGARISLGDGVLRVETAAVAAGALLSALRAGSLGGA